MISEELAFIEELKNPKTKEIAFKNLLKSYQKRLYWHIRRIVLLHEDTDDVLQNTFIKVYHHIDSFKGESKLFSWMYRIATNEALNHLKKKAKYLQISDEAYQEYLMTQIAEEAYYTGNEIQLLLQKAVATLPEKQQLVFKMKYYEELKYDQISEILNVSVGSLKASYHLASKKIEAFLKSD